MVEKKMSAKIVRSILLEEIKEKIITITTVEGEQEQYELAEDSKKKPEDLISYFGELVDVTIVNGKIWDVKSH